MEFYYVPSIILNILYVQILWDRYYYYPHFNKWQKMKQRVKKFVLSSQTE